MIDPDDLRAALNEAARSVPPGDAAAIRDSIGATARRRTRRTRVAAMAAVLAVVGVGVVTLAATNNDPDTLVSTTPTTDAEPIESTAPEPTTPDTSLPSDTVAVPDTTVPTAPRPTGPAELVDRPLVDGAANGENGAPDFGEWVAPWRDGFLVGSGVSQVRVLPTDWPDDIVALFPPEVVELFRSRAPTTVDEAVEMLGDAGLLVAASDVVRDHPEAAAYLYGEPVDEPPVADARFTVDGTTWEPVEMILPMGVASISSVATVGDELVIAYREPSSGASSVFWVARSSDLVDWTAQRVELPAPVELPPGMFSNGLVQDLVVNESGWVLSLLEIPGVDSEALLESAGLPPAQRSSVDAGGLQVVDATGGAERTYTWDELGVSDEAVAYVFRDGAGGPQVWAASWDGEPVRSETDVVFSPIVATPSGFVRWDRQTRFSTDGITWTASEPPNPDGYVVSAFAFDGGVITIGNSFDGQPEVYRLDETGGSIERLDIAGLPTVRQAGYTQGWADASGVVFDGGSQGFSMLNVEAGGYRLSVRPAVGVYELVDLMTGEIVAREIAANAGPEPLFDFSTDGVTVTDPDTGEVLVTIPQERLDESEAAYFEDSGSGPNDEQLTLLASRDGERFVLQPQVGGGSSSGNIGVATNGARALVSTGSGWVSFELP